MWALRLFQLFTCLAMINNCFASKAADMKIVVVALTECELPEEAYDKKEKVTLRMSAYKVNRATTRIRSNFTIERRVGPLSVTIRNYEIVRNTIQNRVGDITNMSCKEVLVATLLKMLKLKFTEDCFVEPGQYAFDDFDVQKLGSFMFLVWRRGRYAHDIEFHTPHGIISCIHAVLDMQPQGAVTPVPKKGTAGKP